MVFNSNDRKNSKVATSCHICGGSLGKDRVTEHCHWSGKFKGTAHNECNLIYKISKFIPVVFHFQFQFQLFIATQKQLQLCSIITLSEKLGNNGKPKRDADPAN